MNKIKIGTFRKIPKGKSVWSITLQEMVTFEKDIIVEITNTLCNNNTHFFGKMKILLFNIPGYIPTLIDKAHGDLGPISYNETERYDVPKPQFFEISFKKDEKV